jgi:tight adherence protein B
VSPILLVSAVAAVGVILVFAALSIPRAGAQQASAAAAARSTRTHRVSLRERVNQPFQMLVERSNQQRRLNGGLTLAENLARADLKLRSSEFMMIQLGFLVAGAAITLWRFGFGPQFVLVGVGCYLLPMRYVKYRQHRRLSQLNARLPDAVGLISNALKAGLSLPQAIETVSRNAPKPIDAELSRVVREMNLGIGAPRALGNMVRRVGSPDLDLVVTAISIQTSVGGNLARLLDTISQTIRQRIQVKAQIAALTAQARASGWIITLLPFVVAAILYFLTPSYFRSMLEDPLGLLMLGMAAVSIVIGNVLIRRIVDLRV